MARLRAAGAELLLLANDQGRVDLPALLSKLATDGVNELHVEAGATLNAALLQTGLVDELLVYLAPKLLGPGRDIAALPALQQLSQAIALRFEDVYRVGDDVCLRARQIAADAFLA
jgi:diaminohydroxyphosphoribosylaminopyrimidine deaminase/5-amino-6-(5-phosphoribosylamino)uracil reductase